MKFAAITRMPFSSQAVWPALARLDSKIAQLFLLLVVPLSLLPPFMIFMAGTHYGDAFIPGFTTKPWGRIAALFFFGELISVAVMGGLIRQVATNWHGQISYRNAYLLASIAPIPLWFSSLGLFFTSLLLNALTSCIALGLSCALIYRGVQAFCAVQEDIEAAAITQVVFGTGMMVWGLLLSLLMLPL